MTTDTVVALRQLGETGAPLTEILRVGARQLLAQAIEAEVAAMVAGHDHLRTGRAPSRGSTRPWARARE
jgi:putative transposase